MRFIKMHLFRFVGIILSVAMLFSVITGCGNNGDGHSSYMSVKNSILETQVLATNSNYELRWEKDAKAVVLSSAIDGTYWSDILYDSFLSGSSANGNSPIVITVFNTQNLKTNTVRSYSEIAENGKIICKKIDNGIRVSYFFDNYKIAIPVDYVLKNDSLCITVDSSKILEEGTEFKLVSVSLVPFMCSVVNNAQDGYLFVPSGSGALMYTAETADGTRKYSGEVYGADATRQVLESYADEAQVKLPVFGASGNGRGMLGIIEKGAGSALIEAQAGNDALGYSNAYATFYVRGYDIFRSESYGTKEDITTRFSEKMSGNEFTLGYYPLYGADADYNGMAKKYREYLTNNDMLYKNEESSSPYSVTMLGGTSIMKSFFGLPYKEIIALTSFSKAKEIVNDLDENIGVIPTVRMLGYGDEGLRPGMIAGGSKYISAYGSKSDISNLDKLFENSSANLFMDSEIVYFSNSGSGFSLNTDTSKTAILKRIIHNPISPTRIIDKKNSYNVIARSKLVDASNVAVKKAQKYGNTAISFSTLGSVAFSDYSSLEYANKNKIESDVGGILNEVRAAGFKVAVDSANGYAACKADVIFDTSVDNGNYRFLDETIPFYQMVFHSYKPMYSEAVNISENTEKSVAKAVAFGLGIGFTVSDGYVDESIDLDEYKLYGTVYEDNRNLIIEYLTKNNYIEIYNKTADSILEKYVLDDNGISISYFSNGIKIYTNHTAETVNSQIGEIDGYSFIME